MNGKITTVKPSERRRRRQQQQTSAAKKKIGSIDNNVSATVLNIWLVWNISVSNYSEMHFTSTWIQFMPFARSVVHSHCAYLEHAASLPLFISHNERAKPIRNERWIFRIPTIFSGKFAFFAFSKSLRLSTRFRKRKKKTKKKYFDSVVGRVKIIFFVFFSINLS